MIAILRIYMKDVNIASATALQAINPDGREEGIRVGANVIMPNITVITSYSIHYTKLYDSASFSSLTTSSAAIATLPASGKPPKVDPCSPGLIVNITSSSANTHDTGITPPDNALPRITISGRTSSWSQA